MKRTIAKFRVGLILAGLMALAAPAAAAAITYVDATDGVGGNTTMVDGSVFTGIAGQAANPDGTWDNRPGFGAGPSVFQNMRSGQLDNAHRLVTTAPVAAGTYNAYLYFWSDETGSDWRAEGSLTDNPGGELPLFIGGGSPAGTPTPTRVLAADFAVPPSGANLTTNGSGQITDFTGRFYWQVFLGQTSGSSVKVYVDDDAAAGSSNQRTWYDGIGYERVVPEPTSFALLGFGLGMLFIGRRKAGR